MSRFSAFPPAGAMANRPKPAPTGPDPNELVEYRRNLLARMGAADARRRAARVSGDPVAIAESESGFRALQDENRDILRVTAPAPRSVQDVEASRDRLRAQFPAAIQGVQRQIAEEQTGLGGRIMGATADPYGPKIIPGMLRRYGELGRELAGSKAREAEGLNFAPYTPREPDTGAVARVSAAQSRRLADRDAMETIEGNTRQTAVLGSQTMRDTALTGATTANTGAKIAAGTSSAAIRAANARAETEALHGELGNSPEAREEARRQLRVQEAIKSQEEAKALGLDVPPDADTARATARFVGDSFGELGGRFLTGPKDSDALAEIEDIVSSIEGIAKTDPERAMALAEQYGASIDQRLPRGEASIYDPSDSPGIVPAGPVLLPGALVDKFATGRPLLESNRRAAAVMKRRLLDAYKKLQKLRPQKA